MLSGADECPPWERSAPSPRLDPRENVALIVARCLPPAHTRHHVPVSKPALESFPVTRFSPSAFTTQSAGLAASDTGVFVHVERDSVAISVGDCLHSVSDERGRLIAAVSDSHGLP